MAVLFFMIVEPFGEFCDLGGNMERVQLLLIRASVLIEAYQMCYEGKGEEAEDKGSFLIECAGEAIEKAIKLLEP